MGPPPDTSKGPPSPTRSSGRARSKSRVVEQPPVGYNPEEGWDDNIDIDVIPEYPRAKIRSDVSNSSRSLKITAPSDFDRNYIYFKRVLPAAGCHVSKDLW